MKRVLWGEFDIEGDSHTAATKLEDIILPSRKVEKLKKLKTAARSADREIKTITLKNPLVTQTIEVMNQTEMLQTLIDTYASKSGYNNYLLNPCQIIPQVDFPPENAVNLISENKFSKPFWFIPPIETRFSKGTTKQYPKITAELATCGIRKTVAGLLRISGFNEASNSSLALLTEATEEFIRNLLDRVKQVQIVELKDNQNILDIETLEKGYSALTHSSLTSIHNYFKNDVVEKNRIEIDEFLDIFHEYHKLMKESQSMCFLDFPGIIHKHRQQGEVSGVNIMNLIESSSTSTENLKYIFEGDAAETTNTDEPMTFSRGGGTPLE